MKNELDKKKLIIKSIFLDWVFSFSIFGFIPYETYLGNISEFDFKLQDFVTPIYITIFVFIVTILFHIVLLFWWGRKIFDIFSSLIFGITVLCYIQSMFLNGVMKKLDGTEMKESVTECLLGFILWIAILIVLILCSIFKNRILNVLIDVICTMILGGQIVAIISLLIAYQEPVRDTVITDKGLYELASENNVIIFCLDKFDQKYLGWMEMLYPDAIKNMNGFTYYPNATGKYCFTHVAVPYLLTGNKIPEYDPTEEQYDLQMKNSNYLQYIINNVGNVGVYTNEYCIRNEQVRSKIDNCLLLEQDVLQRKMAKACFNCSLYRVMPAGIKSFFKYDASDFNQAMYTTDEFRKFDPDTHKTEAEMIDYIEENGLSVNKEYGESLFRFIHVKGAHGLFQLDENGDYVGDENVTRVEQCIAGDFELIGKYCDELERLGLFEDATIIVTADHGEGYVLQPDSPSERTVNPIFFYKPKGVPRKGELEINMAPVAHDDIFATVLESYGMDGSEYGYTIEDIKEGMERTRYFYWCSQDPEITDRESCIHIEYAITGDARDNNNWKETGNYIYPNNNPKHKN